MVHSLLSWLMVDYRKPWRMAADGGSEQGTCGELPSLASLSTVAVMSGSMRFIFTPVLDCRRRRRRCLLRDDVWVGGIRSNS